MTANKILPATINNVIRWAYDAKNAFDNPATIDVSNQAPSAPPTPDAGLAYMQSVLATNNITITTD